MNYELVIVLPGGTTPAKKKTVVKGIEDMVKMHKGTVKKTNDWGKKDLAYNIKKNESGVFVIFELELESEAAAEVKERIRLNEELIRSLLVKVN